MWQATAHVLSIFINVETHGRIVYIPSTGRTRSRYEWRKLDIIEEPIGNWTDRTRFVYQAQPEDQHKSSTNRELSRDLRLNEDILAICTKYNRKYADWLMSEIISLRRYIAWQTHRVTTWAPAPLLPVTHTDNEGFVPTEAAY